MRHNKKFNHLSRKADHRHAMLANMSVSLIMHKRITTTLAKAKALRKYVEPLINRSKEDTTSSRRMVFKYLQNKAAITELFQNIAPKIGDRPGGYTRVIKLGIRKGDAAPIAFIELVDFDENMAKTEKVVKKTRRSRRSGANKAKEETAEVAAEVPVTEEPVVEEAVKEAPVTEETPVEAPAEEPRKEDEPAKEPAEEPAEEVPAETTEEVAPEAEKPEEPAEEEK